jgi:hypothetical protein
MGAISGSNLPGHRQLHERAVATLERCQESQGIDFKESVTWDDLIWHVIHCILGMGNLRDGGVIIVGVSQRGDQGTKRGRVRNGDAYRGDRLSSVRVPVSALPPFPPSVPVSAPCFRPCLREVSPRLRTAQRVLAAERAIRRARCGGRGGPAPRSTVAG